MKTVLGRIAALLGLMTLMHAQTAFAQSASPGAVYPDRPVRFVVGYSPGGLPDTVARILAQKLGERWGQQVVVENRPGANSNIAAEFVARSAPDGYTLLVTDNSTTAINPYIYAKLPFNVDKDFVAVSLAARAPLFLAVHPSVSANTLQELIALIKSKPGQFVYGSSGIGSTHHLCMEYFRSSLGLQMTHVPYKGTGQSVPALISGQVPMLFSALPSLSAYAKDGRVKLLAANSIKRSPFAPTLPAISEVIPGFDFAPTIGVFAPRATAREIVTKLSADVVEAVRSPDTVARLGNVGIESVGTTPEEYASSLKADAERYSVAVKTSGAKAE